MSKYRSVINTTVGLAIIVLVVWSWTTHLQLEWHTWLLFGAFTGLGLNALENLVNRKLWKVQDE